EFDFGSANLDAIAEELNYPIVAANVYKEGKQAFKPYIIKEVDGLKVGIFGMSTPETVFKTHPDNVKGYEFRDIVKTAEETVKTLKETEKADVIIMVSHLGLDEGNDTSDKVAQAVAGIDVIVDGHSHTKLPEGRQVGETLIVSTGDKLQNMGKVQLTITDGKVTAKKASLVGYADVTAVPKQVIVDEIKRVEDEQQVILQEVVGTTAVELIGVREVVRAGESNLGQLATDAMIDLTGAQIAITNGGGIRASIKAGNITMQDMVTVFPFGNTIMVKEIKGSDVIAALEMGTSDYPVAKGAFPHTAGITFTLDAGAAKGNRIKDVKVAGTPIDPSAMYTVATNDFMAVGGDGYTMFKGYPIKEEYNTLMDTLLAYVAKIGEVKGTLVPRMAVINTVNVRSFAEANGFKVVYNKGQITLTKEAVMITLKQGQNTYEAKDQDSTTKGTLRTPIELKEQKNTMDVRDLFVILGELEQAA
ncbi:MAG: bifunctional metallophosphatase/5'-nucleotidase, partial [Cellulosilyticaceae bacterium]